MSAKKYTPEQIQKYIQEAEAGQFYWHVDGLFTRKAVIGGAAKRWQLEEDLVYCPAGRIYGPKAGVLAKVKELSINNATYYGNEEDKGFADELAAYDEFRKNKNKPLSKEQADEILEAIKRPKKEDSPKTEVTLQQRLSSLMTGRAVNVSDAPNKYPTVSVTPSTSSSTLIGLPGIPIVSKTEQGYAHALGELKLAPDVADAYLQAWRAVYLASNSRKKETSVRVPKPSAKKTAPAAKKVAPVASPKKAAPAAKKVAAKK